MGIIVRFPAVHIERASQASKMIHFDLKPEDVKKAENTLEKAAKKVARALLKKRGVKVTKKLERDVGALLLNRTAEYLLLIP